MLFKSRVFAVLGCAIAVGFMSGCGKTAEEVNKVTQSKASAITKIKAALDKSNNSIGGTISSSKATSKASKALTSAVPGTNATPGTDTPAPDTSITDALNKLSTKLETSVTAFLGDGQLSGNDVHYKANATEFCTENSTVPGTPDTDCESFIESHVTIVQKLVNDDSGTLSFMFDSSEILKVAYSSAEVSYLLSLTNLNGVLDVIRENDPTFPDVTTAGTLKASFGVSSTGTATVTLAVPNAVSISGNTDAGPVSFSIAASTKLVQLIGNDTTKTASVEFNMGQLSCTFPYKSSTGEIFLAGLTGKIDVVGDLITVTNMSVGSGMSLKIGGETALAFTADGLDATINGSTGAITLLNHNVNDPTINASFSLTNVAGIFDDMFTTQTHTPTATDSMSANLVVAHNTQIQEYTDSLDNDVTKVVSGSFSITVTDPVNGDGGTVSMVAGKCYDEDSAALLACPAAGTAGA